MEGEKGVADEIWVWMGMRMGMKGGAGWTSPCCHQQGEEKMETGPDHEGLSGTVETMVYYFHVFISE